MGSNPGYLLKYFLLYEDGYIEIFPPSVKDLSFVKLEQGRRHKKILERVFKGFQTLILEKTVWDIIMER